VAGTQLIEVTGTTSSSNHKAVVTGLEPGASYQYAVSSDTTNWSNLYDFAVPAAGPFKFAVIADPQLTTGNVDSDSRYPATSITTAAGWKETMDIISTKGVSLIVSAGDQVDTSSSTQQYTSLFAPDGMKSLPFAPVIGNHDTNALFFTRFNIPNEKGTANSTSAGANYYYLYNNILFVGLNTGGATPTSKSGATTNISSYRTAITSAKTAHAGKYEWLIVQHHKSTASVADHCADTDIQYYVEAGFETLMSELGVDFVLAGHDHVYARSFPLQGKANGEVSVPDKSAGITNMYTNPGNPIYLTFTTASGLKYYAVSSDPYFKYNNSLYVKTNANYPYLGDVTGGGAGSTAKGSTSYMTGNYKPVSNQVFVQPYIPSYTVVEVNGKTIKFSTYPIATKSGTNVGAAQGYSFNKDTAYDWVQVTKN
jgi:predicted phosphodiesterase